MSNSQSYPRLIRWASGTPSRPTEPLEPGASTTATQKASSRQQQLYASLLFPALE